MIVLNEQHLRRIIASYLRYYHSVRTHLSLEKDAPDGRAVQRPGTGKVVALLQVVASITSTSASRPEQLR